MPGDESYDEHEDVRARLAAEPTPRMPADVAARLHATLQQEAQQRAEAQPAEPVTPATVTPLRRRGRWKAPLLAAAGVVAVVAIGIPVINQSSDEDSAGDASSGSGGVFSADEGESAPRSNRAENAEPDETGSAEDFDAGPALTRDDFAADVRERFARTDLLPTETAQQLRSVVRCKGGVPVGSAGWRATLDGDPALVLASRSSGVVAGTEVRAVVCGPDGPQVAARTTLPD